MNEIIGGLYKGGNVINFHLKLYFAAFSIKPWDIFFLKINTISLGISSIIQTISNSDL